MGISPASVSEPRLAFSTLACPTWALKQILTSAREWGYAGVELRGLLDQVDVTLRPEFRGQGLDETRSLLKGTGIQVCVLGSSVHLIGHASEAARERELEEFRRFVDLSRALGGVPIRVFGGTRPETLGEEEAAQVAAAQLDSLAAEAAPAGVDVLVETHDSFVLGSQLAPVLEACSAPNVGVVWDVFNSQIPRAESPRETYERLRPYIRHVHVKDGIFRDSRYEYTQLGRGEIPYREVFSWLREDGYAGWFSVEWEKRWHPELADPEDILPQYARELHRLLAVG